MKPIASFEERIPLVIRRLAGPILLALLVLGGVALLSALGIPTTDVRQNRNYGALAVGIAFALVVTRLLDYIFFDVAFPLRRKTAAPALLRQLVKTVQVGDMIRQAETYGTVEELSWRAIKLRTVEGNVLLIPNSVAGREHLEIFPRPGRPIARFLRVGLEYDAPPEQAREVLQGAVNGLAGLAASPAPVAYVKSFDASAVTYEVRYWLEDYANYLDVDSQGHERVWYALSRAGLAIAYPVIRQHQYAAGKLERPDRRPAIAEAIEKAALFARLPDDQRQRLAGGARERRYAPGETIVREGDRSSSMFLIERGSVGASILRDHPELVQELEATMEERRRHAAGEFDASRGEMGRMEGPLPLAERIARFFGL